MTVKLVIIPGTNHHVPRDMLPFVQDLEKKVSRDKIRYGGLTYKGASKREIDLRHYDENHKILTVSVKDPGYIKTVLIMCEPKELRDIYDFLQGYKF